MTADGSLTQDRFRVRRERVVFPDFGYVPWVRSFGSKARRDDSPESEFAALSAVLGLAGERIGEIAAAADRAVGDVWGEVDSRKLISQRGSSEEQAGDKAVVLPLVNSLMDRTTALQREATTLASMLDRVVSRLAEDGETAEPERSAAPRESERREGPKRLRLAARRRTANDTDAGQSVPDGVRVLATQMAVAGSSESEIETRLRTEFGVEDPAPVLAEVFGRQTPA